MKYLIILTFFSFTIHAQDEEYPPTLIGFVEIGEYHNLYDWVMVGESTHFVKGETIVWFFNAMHTPEEDTLYLCYYHFELKRYTKKYKINVSEGGALGTALPDAGLWRLDILNRRGDVLAKSKLFEVKDVKNL